MSSLNTILTLSFLGLGSLALALAGCAVTADDESTAKSAEALAYSCSGGYCTCTGDDDCNDMFSGNDCGPSAICQINSADIPRCRCKTAFMATPATFAAPRGELAQ